MAATYSYKDAHLVLGEADSLQALNIIDLLSLRGLKNVIVCRNWEQLLNAVAPREGVAPMIDVLVCDVDLPGIDFHQMVQDIRHGRLGGNPFLILIATAQPVVAADVSRVLASGVDDLLIKPIAAEMLVRRLAAFVEGRDPFAITDSYVGPDRRGNRRDQGLGGDASMEVPNTLHSKLVKNIKGTELRAHLDAARKDMASKKTETNLKTIAGMVKRVRQQNVDEVRLGEIRRGLQILADKSDKVSKEFAEARAMATADISARIAQLARKTESGPGRPSLRELDLLEQLSEALLVSFSAPASAAEVARHIVTTVDTFLERAR